MLKTIGDSGPSNPGRDQGSPTGVKFTNSPVSHGSHLEVRLTSSQRSGPGLASRLVWPGRLQSWLDECLPVVYCVTAYQLELITRSEHPAAWLLV